ncbi:dynein axonemal assembly factor 4-like [Leptopilina heterotoma]|uniref:dynein axonemal assembly factor 4-like n=1 Tax=Leptopilina heterotoma TaxID=63436 RepID=UPI001CA92EA2|nr:dynein axonemal assembly factor 4-like [Leptopilina heterotoma]
MPSIVIKNYEWRQTDTNIIINVELFGNPGKIDFFTTNKYVKASYPPYIFELFLWEVVNEEESECTYTQKEMIITLRKNEADLQWPKLELENLSKEVKRECRKIAHEYSQLAAEQKAKAKSEKRQHIQRQAVKHQIDLDTLDLNKIERIRDSHRKEAMRELEEWRLKHEKPIFEGITGIKQENRKEYRSPLKWFDEPPNEKSCNKEPTDANRKPQNPRKEVEIEESVDGKITKIVKDGMKQKEEVKNTDDSLTKNNNKELDNNKKEDTEDSDSDFEDKNHFNDSKSCLIKEMSEKDLKKFSKRKEEIELQKERDRKRVLIQRFIDRRSVKTNDIFNDPNKSIPLPRKCGTIKVSFTERAFPTPARESSHLEEQEWLEKQAKARRQTGFVSEDLRPEEQNPQWLKDKGDEFFKAKNYLGAISAYSHGIKLSEKMSSLYVNRSAAHYALGNFHKCAEDCSTGLELMIPKCEGNRESRARCHARRGAALCKLSVPQHGIPELEAALKLAPDNESIKLDLVAAKKCFKLEN